MSGVDHQGNERGRRRWTSGIRLPWSMPAANCGARNPRSTCMGAPARKKAFWQRSFCCWAPAQLIAFDELRSTKSLRWAVPHCAQIVSAQRSWHGIQLLVHVPGSRQHLGPRHGVHLLVCESRLKDNVAEPDTVSNCLAVNQAQGDISVPGTVST